VSGPTLRRWPDNRAGPGDGGARVSKSLGRGLRLSNRDLNRWDRQVIGTAACDIWAGAIGSDGYGRFSITNPQDGDRMLTPHQVGARLGFGPLPVDCTLMHDCEVRLCCSTAPGHVRIATQRENMRQAVARGRSRGPRPGLVDTRGVVGASRAIQAAIVSAVTADPGIGKTELAAVLAAAVAAGDPLRHLVPLFDAPPPVAVSWWPDDFPVDLFDARAAPRRTVSTVHSLSLFDL
jgi:hypothetical protein